MSGDPVFMLLKWAAWVSALQESQVLGTVVKNYRSPTTNRKPDDVSQYLRRHEVNERKFRDFVVHSSNSNNSDVESKLSSLVGIRFSGSTGEKVNMTGKLFTVKRLGQLDDYWKDLKTNESFKASVPDWVAGKKKKDRPICIVAGILIADDVEVCYDEKEFDKREANGEIPVGAIVTATGVPLPLGDAANIRASVKKEIGVKAVFRAKSEESNIIGLEVMPIASKFGSKDLKYENKPPEDDGQQLGDSEEENFEEGDNVLRAEDLILRGLTEEEKQNDDD